MSAIFDTPVIPKQVQELRRIGVGRQAGDAEAQAFTMLAAALGDACAMDGQSHRQSRPVHPVFKRLEAIQPSGFNHMDILVVSQAAAKRFAVHCDLFVVPGQLYADLVENPIEAVHVVPDEEVGVGALGGDAGKTEQV